MPMNQVIQRRRRELGLTQEQLARALNVTAPAVNKWEKGATCPDVSLLAPLARLLKIDMNELFCFREDPTEAEIQRFAAEVLEAAQHSGLDAAFAMAAEELRQYPHCDALRLQCASVLDGAALLYPEEDGRQEQRAAQIDEWYECCASCEIEAIRRRAAYMLAARHLRREDADAAQRMLDQLGSEPPLDTSPLQIRIRMQQGRTEEAGRLATQALLRCINEAQSYLWQLIDVERSCKNDGAATEMAQRSADLTRLMELWAYNAAIAPLNLALERRDAAESLKLLGQLLQAAAEPWKPEETLLFRRLSGAHGRPDMHRMLSSLLDSLETDPAYDFLRDEPGFRDLIAAHRNC